MNFKSTAVLLVLLLAVGGYVLFSHDKGTSTDVPPTPVVHTVLDVKSADVSAVTVAGPDGKTLVAMEKTDGNWRLTQPVKAAVDTYKATSLLDALTTDLKSTNVIKAADAPTTGIDHPQYTVDLTANGRDIKLALGDRLGVGDGVYAQVAGSDAIDVVPATLLDTLAKPASDLRKTQLFEGVSSTDVKQLALTHKDGTKIELQKTGTAWKIVAPQPAPADSSAVEDLLSTILYLTPVSFVDDPTDAVGMNHPNDVISFSTAAPTTAPATGPAPTVVTIGGYDDVQKKNVFASLSDGTVVKVAATVLDSLNKTPLDLRDKSVVDVDPAMVTKVEVATETSAATQPATQSGTTQPAAVKTVVLTRRPPKPVVMGPTTGPTTGPTSAPATPPTVWVLNGSTDADDAKVTSLLGQFHPLKADKYLPASGITHPARRFTVTITSSSMPPVAVQIDDPGHDLSPVGTANGLTFNLPTSVLTDLAAEFKK
jgi:hypothetical protein